VILHELRHHLWSIHSHNRVRFPGGVSNRNAPRDLQLVKHLSFIELDCLRHNIEMMVVVLGGLGQL
jgi:hypothetical protein